MNIKLGDLCKIQAGGTPSRSKLQYWNNGEIPWVKIGDIDSKYLNKTSEFITDEGLKNSSAKKIEKGSILYTIFATLGEVCITNIDVTTNQAIAGITLKDDRVYIDYLYYFLRSLKNHVNTIGRGVAQNNINLTLLRGFEIPIPDKNRQQIIAQSLSNIEKMINNKKQQLVEYDQLIKSRFVEMFNSSFRDKKCYRLIDEICNLIDYRGKTPEKSDSGIPLITAKNVKSNKFDIEPREYIPAENYNSVMTRGYPKINDVLFTTEAPLGNVCRIPDVYDKFCVGQRLITMQPQKDVLTSEYLEMALLSEEFQEEMWRQSSGSTVKGIRSKLLVKIQVPVPDYDSQIQFSRIVQQVDKLKFEDDF